jgi:hypothetical protein
MRTREKKKEGGTDRGAALPGPAQLAIGARSSREYDNTTRRAWTHDEYVDEDEGLAHESPLLETDRERRIRSSICGRK